MRLVLLLAAAVAAAHAALDTAAVINIQVVNTSRKII